MHQTLDRIVQGWVKIRLENSKLFTGVVRREGKWALTIDEIVEGEEHYTSEKFTACIDWTISTLTTWPDCTRMGYDTWYFKYKRDAEKFNTLFQLKWAI